MALRIGSALYPADFTDGQAGVWDATLGRLVGKSKLLQVATNSSTSLTVTGIGIGNKASLANGVTKPFDNFAFTMPLGVVEVVAFLPYASTGATTGVQAFTMIDKQDGSTVFANSPFVQGTASVGQAVRVATLLDNTQYAEGATVTLRLAGYVSATATTTYNNAFGKQFMYARNLSV